VDPDGRGEDAKMDGGRVWGEVGSALEQRDKVNFVLMLSMGMAIAQWRNRLVDL
jgi:hypothetical protein